ncbi:beta-galactosidase [bacterium]|nr:beta-galactosidase [bacterium]
MKLRTLSVLTILLGLALAPALQAKTLPLDDFESGASLERWQGKLSLNTEYVAHGAKSLKIDLSDPLSRFLFTDKFSVVDWSAWQWLRFDIYNPSGTVQIGEIQIFDGATGGAEEAEFQGTSYRGEKIVLNTGWNHFQFDLHSLRLESGARNLDLSSIRSLRLGLGGIRATALYLDNMRLSSGDEETAAASKAGPWDCRVTVIDRYVYPELYGPEDQLKRPAEILTLRETARREVELLQREVDAAKMMGYATLYWQIPLITAQVGLDIRSKLVWYQSPEKEKEILEYVIRSCRGMREKVDGLLSGLDRELIEEPEDDVNPQKWYVQPYPKLRGLPQREGFFRDAEGKPLEVLGMMLVERGPLLDYFAPYTHRLESYTVGGGSRYNIEESPVYRAFHKYPDTHRVGWDGWCGHLIKDQWSEGGRKENVVICLESPHIKEALKEFMRLHYLEWKNNPNLMYNIMAYELMYICYCDRSQQMFRDWLKAKYGALDKLNAVWRTDYKSFDQVRAPETKNAAPLPDVNRAAWYDWALFNNRRFTDHLVWVKQEMLKLDSTVAICAGGTSSMLSASNSTTGIDEELIINEVDDVILNESGHSCIFSDLLTSLSEKKKAMVDPEMSGGPHGTLLQFLHGKSAIGKWWWARTVSREYHSIDGSSFPQSWEVSLADVDEMLRLGLDVRRLSGEIAEFSRPEPELAILYSKTSILQVPPELAGAGRTPYLEALGKAWEGARFLGCRVGFVSEKQVLEGKLGKFKLLVVPAAKYIPPEVADSVAAYVRAGGTALVIPESFLFDQYAHESDRLGGFGLKVQSVSLPERLGRGENVRNYDMSTSQNVVYGNARNVMQTAGKDIFSGTAPVSLEAEGLLQRLDPGAGEVLAQLPDGSPGLVLERIGSGRLYYLASPLNPDGYHSLFEPLARLTGLNRPVTAVAADGSLLTGAEVRAVERGSDYLVYACNLGGKALEFDLKGASSLGAVTDLRSLEKLPGARVTLAPWQETIFRVEKGH